MLHNSLFVQNNILEVAMQGLVKRNQVIHNNIANNDVPNFKRSTVHFEDRLASAIDSARRTGVLNLDKVRPRVVRHNTTLRYRLDGNNVDIETEMVDLYQNSMRYETLISGIMNNYRRINLALSR